MISVDSQGKSPFVVAICSGKGGVGKSVLTANLGYALACAGANTLIWDANMFFPNQHLLLGVEPPIRLTDVYSGMVKVEKAICKIEDNLSLLADAPATGRMDNYRDGVIYSVFQDLIIDTNFDVILIDVPAGVSDVVVQCADIADRVDIVITDEPTSLLDAYGLIKIFLDYLSKDKMNLLVNNIIDFEDGEEISYKLNMATEKFLGFRLNVVGLTPYDRIVRRSIISQELFVKSEPNSEVSKSIFDMARSIIEKIKIENIVN